MASEFERAVDDIHTYLADELAEPESGLRKSVFRLAQSERGALRRVLWIPTDYESAPVKGSNPICVDGVKRTAIATDRLNVEAHITGTSFQDVEALRAKVMFAARQVMGTDSEPNGGHWVTQEQDRAGYSLGGAELVVQRFTWTLYVFEPLTTGGVATIKHIDTTSRTPIEEPATEEVQETMHAPEEDDED